MRFPARAGAGRNAREMGHRYALHGSGINAVARRGNRAIPVLVAGAGTDKNNECCTRSAYCSCILLQSMPGLYIVGVREKENRAILETRGRDRARERLEERETERERKKRDLCEAARGVGGVGTFCSRCWTSPS